MTLIENQRQLNLKTYHCGSQRLAHNIQKDLGICPIERYMTKDKIFRGKLIKGKVIDVFILCPQLKEYLEQWTKNKPSKQKEAQNG